MKVITGRVVSGKIEFEADLRDGTPVAILAADETSRQLSAEEEDELLESLEQIRSGNYVDGRALLQDLRGSGPRF
ncbi:MAG: hypothetical protein ABI779_23865 [Acidobacteriota bacterium]